MRKERKVWAITLIVLWWLAPSKTIAQQSQDSVRTLSEVVITGTKFEIPVEKSGKFILRLNEQQLRDQSGKNFGDILNSMAGVQVDGNFGTPGSNLNYYVRGARNKQTLILLDGVPMNDPSGIDAFYDLRYVALDQLKSVEILQGGLSTLYGSSATASVINIQSKNADKDGVHGGIDLNAGSWNSYGQNLNLNGRENKFTFQLLANNYSSQGFSAALDKNNAGNFDKDGIERRNGFLKVGYQFSKQFKLDVYGGYDWFDAKYDADAFQDSNDNQVQSQTRVGLKGFYTYGKGSLQVTAQQLNNNREFKSTYPAVYDGNNQFAEIIHTHQVANFAKILSGISFQQLKYGEKDASSKDTTKFTIVDPYTSLFLDFENGLQIHVGARLNTHSEYGSKLLYNLNPSWNFSLNERAKIKLFGSISSSFITPSLYQLYSPYGNKGLKPEEDSNYEYGVSLSASNKLTISAVNFYRNEKNTIGYITRYENLSSNRKVSGVTVDGVYKASSLFDINVDYTYQSTDNEKTFYRIPKEKFGIGLTVRPIQQMQVMASYRHTSNRTDLYFDENFKANKINLSSYDLIDLSASHELMSKKLMVYGSVNNLFDENFIGVYGYTTRGRNFTIGVKYNF
jgi:vitamin B12 transporter